MRVKSDSSIIMLCYIMKNFNKGKISYVVDFSNVLYLIVIDRCLKNKLVSCKNVLIFKVVDFFFKFRYNR